jgi:Domain of unknown function (DUF4055)
MTIDDPNLPTYQSPQYNAALSDLRFVGDMYQGIRAWIDADGVASERATLYLPSAPREDPGNYGRRLYRSSFDRRYGNAIDAFAGSLSKFGFTGDLPKLFAENERNIDRSNNTLARFLIQADIAALRDGVAYILVDYPKKPTLSGRIITYADEKRMGLRPFLSLYQAQDVINLVANASGDMQLIVFREAISQPIGSYGQQLVQHYRVLYPGGGQLYQMVSNGGTLARQMPQLIDEWATDHQFITVVPYSIGINLADTQSIKPPLLDLALLNLHHYRKVSYKDELMMKCNLPILEIKKDNSALTIPVPGQSNELEQEIVIGANTVLYNTTSHYVEPTGSALALTIEDIKNLENAMAQNTLDFITQGSPRTATEVLQSSAATSANLTGMVTAKQAAVSKIFDYWDFYANGNGHTTAIQIDEDTLQSTINSASLNRLESLRLAGDISRHTYLTLLKESKVLPQTLEVDDEITRIEQEALINGGREHV